MAWLVRDGKVLATLEVATSLRERTRGLIGRDGIDGAILLRPAKSVHTFRMHFAIDVAFCDRDLRVVKVTTLARNRVTLPVIRAHAAIESEAGTMARWGVCVGDQLDIRGLDDAEHAAAAGSGAPAPTGATAPNGSDGNGSGPAEVIDVRDRWAAAGGTPTFERNPSADITPDVDGGRG